MRKEYFESRLVSHVLLAVLVVLLFWIATSLEKVAPNEEISGVSSGWQAIFLENGQTYFGKLVSHDAEYYKLERVYYLRSGESIQKGNDSENYSLVKLGGEFHGPEDALYVRKEAVLFWENLKDSSRVVSLIRTMK